MMMLQQVTLFLCIGAAVAQTAANQTGDFPIIDLGYARHAPTVINQTTLHNISYATYSNIRFAQPPVRELRFRRPQLPPPFSPGVQDGVVPFNSTNCLQSIPNYFPLPGLNGSSWGSEDCLFLDVVVPEGIQEGEIVPVLHWIYGGGYFFGAKDNGGNPTALFGEMTADQKFVIVASNYRLGAVGWMGAEDPSMTANAGLYDSLAALEWTRDNIHRFGGDRSNITVMGQSAGAGIIEHLLAAKAQGRDVPFNQVILSSPGYRPHVNRSQEMTGLWQRFLNQTNCSSIDCVRTLDSAVIAEANRFLYMDSEPDGGFPGPSISFGPVIDDDLVQDLPERILEAREINPSPGLPVRRIIAGNMANDGAAVTIGNFTSWTDQLSIFARIPTESTVSEIESLYGSFDGSRTSFNPDGTVNITPFDEFSGDIIYACHAQVAAERYSNESAANSECLDRQPRLWSSAYRYEMSVQPALHGQDLSWYFYSPLVAAVDPTVVAPVAHQFQSQLRLFILGEELENWPEYSSTGLDTPSWVNITAEGLEIVVGGDGQIRSERCGRIVQLLSTQEDGW